MLTTFLVSFTIAFVALYCIRARSAWLDGFLNTFHICKFNTYSKMLANVDKASKDNYSYWYNKGAKAAVKEFASMHEEESWYD